jgi:hypothetical protein
MRGQPVIRRAQDHRPKGFFRTAFSRRASPYSCVEVVMTSKPSIVNLHRANTTNIGDLMCAPALYFPDLFSDRLEILGFKADENPDSQEEWRARFDAASTIVVGGGGLLEIDFFERGLAYLFANKRPEVKTILWGAGHNNWNGDWRKLKQKLSLDQYPFDLIGVRDYNSSYEWLPCVSCMHPAFDRAPLPTRDVVLYAHADAFKIPHFAERLPKGLPTLDNSASMEDAVEFLASGELVLTDSFHGLYWATLLGRRVIAFPTTSKFYSVKHPAPLCDPSDWKRFEPMAKSYPMALHECREATKAFAARVAALATATPGEPPSKQAAETGAPSTGDADRDQQPASDQAEGEPRPIAHG